MIWAHVTRNISQAFTILIPTLKSRDILECGIYYITTVSYDIFLKRVSECVNFYDFHFFLYSISSLQYIPMPVLYGVLMYMGVSSLKGMQFIDRVGLIFMPPKYQPDYYYLRHVPIKKVHLFTFIQV